jgi:glutamate dehydrogenase
VYWHVFETLDVTWLWEAIGGLPRNDRWQTQARAALRDDLLTVLADLTADVLAVGGVERWIELNVRVVARTGAMFTEIRRAEGHDITTLTVALRQLRNLSLTTQHDGITDGVAPRPRPTPLVTTGADDGGPVASSAS